MNILDQNITKYIEYLICKLKKVAYGVEYFHDFPYCTVRWNIVLVMLRNVRQSINTETLHQKCNKNKLVTWTIIRILFSPKLDIVLTV